MFPLKNRDLIRGCQAHKDAGLGCAGDYVADYDLLYAPFDGTLRAWWGIQGGKWLTLTRDNGDKIQFAHLSVRHKKTGKVKAGELIAVTGNTGRITTGPHLHIQIKRNGERLNPEKYNWDKPMDTIKIKVHGYDVDTRLIESWLAQAKDYYSPVFNLEFDFDKIKIDEPTFLYNGYPNYHDYNTKYPSPISVVFLSPEVATDNGFNHFGINFNNAGVITNYVVAHEFDYMSGTPGYQRGYDSLIHEIRHAIVDRYRNHVKDQTIPDTTHDIVKSSSGKPNYLMGIESFIINEEDTMVKLVKQKDIPFVFAVHPDGSLHHVDSYPALEKWNRVFWDKNNVEEVDRLDWDKVEGDIHVKPSS